MLYEAAAERHLPPLRTFRRLVYDGILPVSRSADTIVVEQLA